MEVYKKIEIYINNNNIKNRSKLEKIVNVYWIKKAESLKSYSFIPCDVIIQN